MPFEGSRVRCFSSIPEKGSSAANAHPPSATPIPSAARSRFTLLIWFSSFALLFFVGYSKFKKNSSKEAETKKEELSREEKFAPKLEEEEKEEKEKAEEDGEEEKENEDATEEEKVDRESTEDAQLNRQTQIINLENEPSKDAGEHKVTPPVASNQTSSEEAHQDDSTPSQDADPSAEALLIARKLAFHSRSDLQELNKLQLEIAAELRELWSTRRDLLTAIIDASRPHDVPGSDSDPPISLEDAKNLVATLRKQFEALADEQSRSVRSAISKFEDETLEDTVKVILRKFQKLHDLTLRRQAELQQQFAFLLEEKTRKLMAEANEREAALRAAMLKQHDDAIRDSEMRFQAEISALREVNSQTLRELEQHLDVAQQRLASHADYLELSDKAKFTYSILTLFERTHLHLPGHGDDPNAERSQPVAELWTRLKRFGLDDPVSLLAVESVSEATLKHGVPRLSHLQRAFTAVRREAMEASLRASTPNPNSIWAHILSSVASFFLLNIPRPSVSPSDHHSALEVANAQSFPSALLETDFEHLSVAASLVADGALEHALSELSILSPAAREVVSDWMAEVQERVVAEQAYRVLQAQVLLAAAHVARE